MLKNCDINIRDPFVLVHNGKYYLYGSRGPETWGHCTGFDVYTGTDLENWEGPYEVFTPPAGFWSDRNFWAPEVHEYQGSFYMFASFKSEDQCRGTQILKADRPEGPFRLHSDGPVTPRDWECLDGTFFVEEDGQPYMVFCHEWLQVTDGTMCAMPLEKELTKAAGEPVVLFYGSDPKWARKDADSYVTDGPFLHRCHNGDLLMIWSSLAGAYVEAVAKSESGTVLGPWEQQTQLLFEKDGGHGMIFLDLEGRLRLVLHTPNDTLKERPVFYELEEKDGYIRLR